jgi:hypothetical protein
MKVKGISASELCAIVREVSGRDYDGNVIFKREPELIGNFLFFTLTVIKSANPGGKRSPSGRKVSAACWHAHRDIMQVIFNSNPDALLVTALARYDGKQDFEYSFPTTGETNIGSMYEPFYMQDACDCCE